MQPHIAAKRTRGPQPAVSYLDAFLCILIWYKLGFNYHELSVFTHLKRTTMVSALDRIMPILLATLKDRWCTDPIRPK